VLLAKRVLSASDGKEEIKRRGRTDVTDYFVSSSSLSLLPSGKFNITPSIAAVANNALRTVLSVSRVSPFISSSPSFYKTQNFGNLDEPFCLALIKSITDNSKCQGVKVCLDYFVITKTRKSYIYKKTIQFLSGKKKGFFIVQIVKAILG